MICRLIAARVPLFALILSIGALILTLVMTAGRLPERVASHFNAAGVADGWMSRDTHLWTFGGLVIGLSVILPVVFYCLRLLPLSGINLPNRDYWLAPERRDETYAVMFRFGIWFTCMLILLMLGLHLLVVSANEAQPPRMSDSVWFLSGSFLVATGVWVYLLVRRFSKLSF